MRRLPVILRTVCILLGAGLAAPAALAQSGTEMLLSPWDDDQQLAFEASMGLANTRADAPGGADVRMWQARERGMLHTPRMPFMVGWKTDFVGFDAPGAPGLPSTLHDTGVSLATLLTPGADNSVRAFGEDWDIGIEAGVGHASTSFDDSQGLYFTGSMLMTGDISDHETLKVALSYDGNRSLLPDVPLPGFEYRNRGRKEFVWFVGVPRLGFVWKPDERWTVEAEWNLLTPGPFRVDYALGAGWHLFGFYGTRKLAVHAEDDAEHRRLFWSANELRAGLAWQPRPGVELSFSAGWAFGMEIERGWDSRDTDTVFELDDAAVAEVRLKIKL